MYIQTILQRETDKLIRRPCNVQNKEPSNGYFFQPIIQDCQLIVCQMRCDTCCMDKYSFKVIVKKKDNKAVFRSLIAIRETKSKMENIMYLNSFNPTG